MSTARILPLLISPLPPVHSEELPHVGAGLRFLESPTNYFIELREKYGDTFFVSIFGFNLLMTFSPKGLESLYKFEEDEASFLMATFDMIGFKTPIETLIDTDAMLFYRLLMHKKMPQYVETMATVVDMELERWGEGGKLEMFDTIRTLEQRVGYGLWISEEAAMEPNWQELKAYFDVLDQEKSFVDPSATLETIRSGKSKEKQAAKGLYELLPKIFLQHDTNPNKKYASADFFREHFAGQENLDRKVLNNTINANQGFLSNLYAAIAWAVVRLAEHSLVLEKVRNEIAQVKKEFGPNFLSSIEALNSMDYLEQVLMESVRIAQRSLTLRKVMSPIDFDDGNQIYHVKEDVYIATMSSVTNTQEPGLQAFNPDNYNKNRLSESVTIAGKETISTFGHGKHACPAQRFSHHMCKIVIVKLLDKFDIRAAFEGTPAPSNKQMGGVARPEVPTYVHLTRI